MRSLFDAGLRSLHERFAFSVQMAKSLATGAFDLGHTGERASVCAARGHRPASTTADAHGSDARRPSRLCLGSGPLALGRTRLRVDARPLATSPIWRPLETGALAGSRAELVL